jgi:hypothetical protein
MEGRTRDGTNAGGGGGGGGSLGASWTAGEGPAKRDKRSLRGVGEWAREEEDGASKGCTGDREVVAARMWGGKGGGGQDGSGTRSSSIGVSGCDEKRDGDGDVPR